MRAAAIGTVFVVAFAGASARAECTEAARCTSVLASVSATSLVASSSRVFFTDAAGRLSSVAKWGGATATLALAENGASVDGSDGRWIYWHTGAHVRRIPENGGPSELLYSYPPAYGNVFTEVVVTPHALFVTSTDAIWRLAPEGTTQIGASGALVAWRSPTVLFVGSTSRAWPGRYRLDGGSAISIMNNASVVGDTRHGLHALFALVDHRLVRIEGGTATVLATQQDIGGRIVVEGDDLYWTNPQAGSIRKTSVYGGAIDVLAERQSHPKLIAADADSIYWTADHAIVRVTPR